MDAGQCRAPIAEPKIRKQTPSQHATKRAVNGLVNCHWYLSPTKEFI